MASTLTFNLADLFESIADVVPDRPAIVSNQRQLSFGELDQRATRLANCWKALGIGLEFKEVSDLSEAEVRIGYSTADGSSASMVGKDVLQVPLRNDDAPSPSVPILTLPPSH